MKSKEDKTIKNKKEKVKKKNKVTYGLLEVVIFSIIFLFFGILIGYLLNYGKDTFTGNRISTKLEEFIETYNTITKNYYGDLKEDKLIEAAINGMVDAIGDPYSNYIDDNNVDEFNDDIKGYYNGIGVTISNYQNNNKVIYVNDGGPADKAGIKVDDIIIKVDGEDVSNVFGNDLSNIIRGKANSSVIVTVKRDDKEIDLKIKRKKIEITSVTSNIIKNNNKSVGVLKVSNFSKTTYNQFIKELNKLEKDKIDSLIIDVRDNLGGELYSTADILSIFFNKKTLLFQIKDNKSTNKIYGLNNSTKKYPVAILINKRSASASEVVASCFKENYKKVYIVGENSYGKGTVQKTLTLNNGTKIKYTIQKWLTSKGKWIDKKGVKPDYEVINNEEYYNNPINENDDQLNKAVELLTQ